MSITYFDTLTLKDHKYVLPKQKTKQKKFMLVKKKKRERSLINGLKSV